jgi:LPS export ABC transporter protein LptC
MPKYLIILGGGIWLMCLVFCSKIQEDRQLEKIEGEYPVLQMKDSITVDMYDGSYLAWILKTNYMRKMDKSNIIFAKPIDMVIYDSLKQASAWVEADSGMADEAVTFVSVWGSVYAKSLEGATVEADSLIWKKRSNQIRTDGWVKVVSEEGDTLTGIGFVSDDKLENWKILSSVRGVILNVEERVNESDEPAEEDSSENK